MRQLYAYSQDPVRAEYCNSDLGAGMMVIMTDINLRRMENIIQLNLEDIRYPVQTYS